MSGAQVLRVRFGCSISCSMILRSDGIWVVRVATTQLTKSQDCPQGRGKGTGKEGWFRSNKELRSLGKHYGYLGRDGRLAGSERGTGSGPGERQEYRFDLTRLSS